jgi:hypothetical protein
MVQYMVMLLCETLIPQVVRMQARDGLYLGNITPCICLIIVGLLIVLLLYYLENQ